MAESSDGEYQRIEAEVTAMIAAEHWRLINARLCALEGEQWATAEEEVELFEVLEGPDAGRVFWKVGARQFSVDEFVVETVLGGEGRPTRRRVIGREGVVADGLIVNPSLN